MRRFRNDHTLSSRHRLLEVLHSVIPNLFRDLCFAPLGGRWTVDGQPSLQQRSTYFSKRPAALKRACFGIFVLLLSEDGGPLTLNVAFSSDQRVSVLKRTAVVWARSRTGALRDDRRGVRRGRLYGMSVLLPSRHPDNAPGQDLGLCRVFETRSRAKASRDDRKARC